MELAWEVFFVGVLPLLTMLFGFLHLILKLNKKVKELEEALEKERRENGRRQGGQKRDRKGGGGGGMRLSRER